MGTALQMSENDSKWMLVRSDRTNVQSSMSLCCYKEYLGKIGLGADPSASLDIPATQEVTGEAAIVDYLLTRRLIGIRDDYHFWRGHKYVPQGGKPLWVTADDTSVHH